MPQLGWSEDPIRGVCLTWGGLRILYVVNAAVEVVGGTFED